MTPINGATSNTRLDDRDSLRIEMAKRAVYSQLHVAGMWLVVAAAVVVLCVLQLAECSGGGECPDGCACNIDMHSVSIRCSQPLPVDKLTAEIEQLLSLQSANDVTILQIADTPLTSVPPSACRLSALQSFAMTDSQLVKLPDNCFTKMPHLQTFIARQNHIRELQDGLFDGLGRLKTIDLNYNDIATIGLRVFANASDLRSLVSVGLGGNKLQSLEPWPMVRASALENTTLEFMGMFDGNLISKFTNEMNWTYNFGREPARLSFHHNRISHVKDWTTGWGIDDMTLLDYLFQRDRDFWIDFNRNPFVCDCVDFDFISQVDSWPHSTVLDECFCEEPPDLRGKQVKRVDQLFFVCNVTERCPPGCSCVDRPRNSTMHVNCDAAGNMTSVPLEVPALPRRRYRYKLNYNGNPWLTHVEPREYFENTAVLDVGNCGVESVDPDAWKQLVAIDVVDLHGNRLRQLPKSFASVNMSNSTVLDLSDNPWDCTCDRRWFKHWLSGIVNHLRYPERIRCSSPRKCLLTLPDDDFCIDPELKMGLVVGSPIVAFFLLIFLTVGLMYKCRYRLYAKWQVHVFDRDECDGEEMDYDVFLSSSSVDDALSVRTLELLENKGYRVCFHGRDFLAGEKIQDNIYRAIAGSKRTLCLLTQNFLDSPICRSEFDTARQHGVRIGRNRIVVLMMLDEPRRLVSDETAVDNLTGLRRHLRQYTYVDRRSKDWLSRLMYALPIRRMGARLQDADADGGDVGMLTA